MADKRQLQACVHCEQVIKWDPREQCWRAGDFAWCRVAGGHVPMEPKKVRK